MSKKLLFSGVTAACSIVGCVTFGVGVRWSLETGGNNLLALGVIMVGGLICVVSIRVMSLIGRMRE